MKSRLFLIITSILFFSFETFAQKDERQSSSETKTDEIQTLSANGVESGGYGAMAMSFTSFKGKGLPMMGIRGGWIINHVITLGAEANGMMPFASYELNTDDGITLGQVRTVGGYGGFLIEPTILHSKIVHINLPLTIGLGWMGYMNDWDGQNNYEPEIIDSNSFWYWQPGVGAELNVSSFFRINVVLSYRFVYDLHLIATETNAFDSWNLGIFLKFGKF